MWPLRSAAVPSLDTALAAFADPLVAMLGGLVLVHVLDVLHSSQPGAHTSKGGAVMATSSGAA